MQFVECAINSELLDALPYIPKLQHLTLRFQPAELLLSILKPVWLCLNLKSLHLSHADIPSTLVSHLSVSK